MNKQRLLTLADFLETVQPRRFNMRFWWLVNEGTCYTAGCAAGWACQIPEFQQAGLRLDEHAPNAPSFRHDAGYFALEAFFDLTNEQTVHLFSSSSYPRRPHVRPRTVSRRIRELVKEAS